MRVNESQGATSFQGVELAVPVGVNLPPNKSRQQSQPPCLNPQCVGCGPENPHGLRLLFSATEGGVSAPWSPGQHWQSYPDTVHGGIVTTVLDEAMSKAVIAMGWRAFTMDLRVRFHSMVRPGNLYVVTARVIEKRKRKITAEATITSRGGLEHAAAWATFLQISGRE